MEKCNIPGVFTVDELKKTPGYKMKEIEGKNNACVLIECVEDIPCNPCETSCPTGAITVGKPITNLPSVDLDKCKGCGICIAACPGLAIFVLKYDDGDGNATLMFPYEYKNIPKVGSKVNATNRLGETVCVAEVISVIKPGVESKTYVITIKFPKQYVQDVRGIEL
ncbi:MAG: 4Fe-4S binding protein [Oscillospiraceae bacterium]|nr:4Fe-4S binding protein [Oscillospiraceae bacterium]